MMQSPLWLPACVVLGIVATFFVVFALKVAVFEWWKRQGQPRGFEIKSTDPKPVLKEKEIDHG
jgi:hypothetical protein